MATLRMLQILSVVAACLGTCALATADDYPSRTVKIIVPIGAGGPVDTVSRAVAEHLSTDLKQPFIIENRPGAGGNLGIVAGIKAPPDGYTLLTALGTMLTINPGLFKPTPFDPETQLRPISILTTSSQVLVVRPTFPAKTLEEFVALAKKKPPTYGTTGFGTPSHLTMEYLRRLAGFDATAVTYRSTPEMLRDIIAGQVDVGFVATAGARGLIKAGKLRALAISSATRSKLAPDVPTIAESGFPQFDFASYILILAPAGTPDAIVARLGREVRAAVKTPQFVTRFGASDIEAVGSTGEDAVKWIGSETKRWAEFLKSAHIETN